MTLSAGLGLLLLLAGLSGCQTKGPRRHLPPEERAARIELTREKLAAAEPRLARLKEAEDERALFRAILDMKLGGTDFQTTHDRWLELQKELKDLRYRYLDGHPKVRETQRRLTATKTELDRLAQWLTYQLERDIRNHRDTIKRLEAETAAAAEAEAAP